MTRTVPRRTCQGYWPLRWTLRFLDGPHGALILGPVGVGKTYLATALGPHRRAPPRVGVHMTRADKLFKRLKAARDNTSRPRHAASPKPNY
jgi:DNA replication protein DnaC